MIKGLRNFRVNIKKITSNKSLMKKVCNVLVAVAYVTFIVAVVSEFGFADVESDLSDSTNLVGGINALLAETKSVILKFSAFAVIIGVGVGAMMKKFSMGKQDKIEMGNKLMKDSIIAFAILNATPRIVNFVINKVGKGDETIGG